MKGDQEWVDLQDALEVHTPNCENDARFIADSESLSPEEISDMRSLCDRCPLQAACAAYATAAKPTGGFWANHSTRTYKRKDNHQ